jgi:hypothetical protein
MSTGLRRRVEVLDDRLIVWRASVRGVFTRRLHDE